MFNNIKLACTSLTSTTATMFTITAGTMEVLADKANTILEGYKQASKLEKKAYINERLTDAVERYTDSCIKVQETYKKIEEKASKLDKKFKEEYDKTLKEFENQDKK